MIDAAASKGLEEVEKVRARTAEALEKYVVLANRLGFAADSRLGVGTDAVEQGFELCREVHRRCPRALFFMGNLLFPNDSLFTRLLHNEMAYQLQRRLHFDGMNAIVLPVRVRPKKAHKEAAAKQPARVINIGVGV